MVIEQKGERFGNEVSQLEKNRQWHVQAVVVTEKMKVPSLVELCIRTIIDNVKYLGDVGETDIDLLRDILPHCTLDQLKHIEESSQGRDLSPVTNKLWRRFYIQEFSQKDFDGVIEKMRQRGIRTLNWRKAYEAKLVVLEEARVEFVKNLKERYKEEDLKKQSRQIQICSKVPPSSNKRKFYGGSSGTYNKFSNTKGNLMKKAKIEFHNSHEAKIHLAMRKKALQRTQGAPLSMRPSGVSGKNSASSYKLIKPFRRL